MLARLKKSMNNKKLWNNPRDKQESNAYRKKLFSS